MHLDQERGVGNGRNAIVGIAGVGSHLMSRNVAELEKLSTNGAYCRTVDMLIRNYLTELSSHFLLTLDAVHVDGASIVATPLHLGLWIARRRAAHVERLPLLDDDIASEVGRIDICR